MFAKKTPVQKTGLEIAIDDLLKEMSDLSGEDAAYSKMVTQLDVLYKLKEVDQKIASGRRVSPDTWALALANIFGIVLIVGHERANVLTSKALTFVSKLR